MRVLVACEFSGIVREAFRAKGHDALSCDLMPSDLPGPHYQGDVRDVLHACWDLMIFHAPCTNICVSGAAWFKEKRLDGRQAQGISFFMELWRHGERYIDKMVAEQPIGIMSSLFRKPDQIIQPWQFGHGETKATCLWFKNLPLLKSTNIVEGREQRLHRLPPSSDRSKIRSTTFQGIANAMAEQWNF
ncbi:MAG: DNA cytosine methyltransferase [Planctomycetes bacterium]|nr:DNA cytosine methyltransferase [Planctomycetota bacterium]MDE2144890.1 DNA cytosine methyltransferase [Patescibacteria group bacterium]